MGAIKVSAIINDALITDGVKPEIITIHSEIDYNLEGNNFKYWVVWEVKYEDNIKNYIEQLPTYSESNMTINEAKEKVTLSQGITTIKSKAFGRNAINIIYFPESIEEVASDTFEDGSVNKIQTRMSETSFKGIDGWTYYDLFGTSEDWHRIVEFID